MACDMILASSKGGKPGRRVLGKVSLLRDLWEATLSLLQDTMASACGRGHGYTPCGHEHC